MTKPRKFWTQIATSQKASLANQKDLEQAKLEDEAILTELKQIKFASLLEIGCATGAFTKQIKQSYPDARVVGVDFIPEFIDQAKQDSAGVEFYVGDIEHLEGVPESFDVVVSKRCLINLQTDKAQKQALKTVKRILKPVGMFILLESTKQGYEKLNCARRKVGLPPVTPAKHNHPLDLTKFGAEGFKGKGSDPFATYYLLTRVWYPATLGEKKPEYNTLLHTQAALFQRCFGDVYPNVSPLILWSLKKID